MYLWTALDKETKLVASFLVGKRSADNARKLMVDLAARLALPQTAAQNAVTYITQISTDGFAAYPEAVDLAFGASVKYGQIIKDYRNADQPGRYAPPEMVGTNRRGVFGIGESETRSIVTSHVERHNLTIRTLMKRFTRLSLGFSKKLVNLEAAVAMFMAYYNFCWRTHDVVNNKTRLTAAMAVGKTDAPMTFEQLFDRVMNTAA